MTRTYLLPRFIPLLQQTSNKLALYVEEGTTSELTTRLRNGDLEALLISLPFAEADVATLPPSGAIFSSHSQSIRIGTANSPSPKLTLVSPS
jgi:hypothetical protein